MSSLPAHHQDAAGDRLMRVRVTLKGRPIRSYVFKQEQVLIGRNPEADLFLDNPGVSRDHLRLERASNGDYVLQDVGSANGTLLNDQPVTSKRLYDQDVIQIGKFALMISYEIDPRGSESTNRKAMPTADDGTMVLSSADLENMLKKAHAPEVKPLKGPWPEGIGSAAGGIDKATARRIRAYVGVALALGAVFGAGTTFAIMHFLKH